MRSNLIKNPRVKEFMVFLQQQVDAEPLKLKMRATHVDSSGKTFFIDKSGKRQSTMMPSAWSHKRRYQSKYGPKQEFLYIYNSNSYVSVFVYHRAVSIQFGRGGEMGSPSIADVLANQTYISAGFNSGVLMFLDLFSSDDVTSYKHEDGTTVEFHSYLADIKK